MVRAEHRKAVEKADYLETDPGDQPWLRGTGRAQACLAILLFIDVFFTN